MKHAGGLIPLNDQMLVTFSDEKIVKNSNPCSEKSNIASSTVFFLDQACSKTSVKHCHSTIQFVFVPSCHITSLMVAL